MVFNKPENYKIAYCPKCGKDIETYFDNICFVTLDSLITGSSDVPSKL